MDKQHYHGQLLTLAAAAAAAVKATLNVQMEVLSM